MEMNPEVLYLHPFPAFGNWDPSGNMPAAQYLQSNQDYAGGFCLSRNELPYLHNGPTGLPLWDVFECTPLPPQAFYRKGNETAKRIDGGGAGKEMKKPARICDVALEPPIPAPLAGSMKAPRAVDEDLYQIPPEWLRRRNRRVGHSIGLPHRALTVRMSHASMSS